MIRGLQVLLWVVLLALTSTPSWAHCRPETRVGGLPTFSSHFAPADAAQPIESQQANTGWGYDFASGVHKYLYCQGNPVMGSDPSGHDLVSTMATVSIMSGLGGAIIGGATGGAKGAAKGFVTGLVTGATLSLGGAGIGAAILGNAARGIFLTGVAATTTTFGVGGYFFATATTSEERYYTGVGLIVNAAFVGFGPKLLQNVNTRIISARVANDEYVARGNQPPWQDGSDVIEYTTYQPSVYVRVYLKGVTQPVGRWVTLKSEIEGLSMDQIQQKFALPFTPDSISTESIPAGNTVRMGTAGANDFSPSGGGGLQVEVRTSNPPATAK